MGPSRCTRENSVVNMHSVAVPQDQRAGGTDSEDAALQLPLIEFAEKEDAREVSSKGISSVYGTSYNMMNTMLGAGLMALPHLFASSGMLVSVFMAIVTMLVMYQTIVVLVRVANQSGDRTYTEVARNELGKPAGVIIQVSILLNNSGVLLVYLIIIGDLLVGTEDTGFNGLVPTLLKIHSGKVWYASRWFVILLVCIFILQPLVLQQRLDNLAGTSAFAYMLAAIFAAVTTGLAISGALKGKLARVSLWPDPNIEDGIEKNCTTAIIMSSATVMVYAYVAHYNVPPLMASLKNYTKSRMLRSVQFSFIGTTLLYLIISITSYMVFGRETQQDVLVNMNPVSLSKLVNAKLANTISVILSLGYAAKLTFVFPMENWSLRENVSDLIFGTQHPTGWKFYACTYGILSVIYMMSVFVHGILDAINIIGCTACVGIAFVIPAWLMRKHDSHKPSSKFLAYALWVFGAVCLVEGIIGVVWRKIYQVPLFC